MSDPSWEPCPAGEIQSLAQQLRGRGHQRTALVSVVAVALLLVGTLTVVVFNQRDVQKQSIPISITCTECMELFVDYNGGNLSSGRVRQVKHHLDQCPSCRMEFNKMRQKNPRST